MADDWRNGLAGTNPNSGMDYRIPIEDPMRPGPYSPIANPENLGWTEILKWAGALPGQGYLFGSQRDNNGGLSTYLQTRQRLYDAQKR